MKIKTMMPTQLHQSFRDELHKVCVKYGEHMSPGEAIGIMAQLIGQIVAVARPDANIDEVVEVMGRNVRSGVETTKLHIGPSQGNA